jgi:hypothetical protein
MDPEELIIQSNQDVHVWFDMVAKMMGNEWDRKKEVKV